MSERQIRLLAELTEMKMNFVVKRHELWREKETQGYSDGDLNEAINELSRAIKLMDELRLETNTMDQFD